MKTCSAVDGGRSDDAFVSSSVSVSDDAMCELAGENNSQTLVAHWSCGAHSSVSVSVGQVWWIYTKVVACMLAVSKAVCNLRV